MLEVFQLVVFGGEVRGEVGTANLKRRVIHLHVCIKIRSRQIKEMYKSREKKYIQQRKVDRGRGV